jgi:hypothetical protein
MKSGSNSSAASGATSEGTRGAALVQSMKRKMLGKAGVVRLSRARSSSRSLQIAPPPPTAIFLQVREPTADRKEKDEHQKPDKIDPYQT